MPANKSLGQHWLTDRSVLKSIADCADIKPTTTVLEIGPGLGTLTSVLLSRAERVVAIEIDSDLARKLPGQFPGKRLTVHNEDILTFDLSDMPEGYVVVANVPYYITSKIVHYLSEAANPPSQVVLLVQKEVAERLAAEPGSMSIAAVAAQVYHEVSLGPVVPAALFTPPPKVDSQVVVMRRQPEPRVDPQLAAVFFRTVKAGFSARRKKLRTSLSGGLAVSKPAIESLLVRAELSPDLRAEDLSVDDWLRLSKLV